MKKRLLFKTVILIFILCLLILTCHSHPHSLMDKDEDSHCPVCQLLHTGLVFTPKFYLVFYFIFIVVVNLIQESKIKTNPLFSYQFRAPPFLIPTF